MAIHQIVVDMLQRVLYAETRVVQVRVERSTIGKGAVD